MQKTSDSLGVLLLEAGLITGLQLSKATQRSRATGLPLGRILVLNQVITEEVLEEALELQVRIRDGMLMHTEAVLALRAIGAETVMLLPDEPPSGKGLRIGELFVPAGLLSQTDVLNALEISLEHNQKIGTVLMEQGYISLEQLEVALEFQERIDTGQLQPSEAARLLAAIESMRFEPD